MIIDWKLIFTRIPVIMQFFPATVELVLLSTLFSLIIGFLLALARIHRVPVLYQITAVYVSIARGTPAIIQLYLIFYGIPVLIRLINGSFGTDFSTVAPPMVCAVAAFTFNEAAFSSENIRSALQSVDRGQWEAAESIGMSTFQTYRRIILPEALVVALPPMGNAFISQIKNTSLAFTCAVVELTAGAKLIAGHDYRYFEAYCSLAIIYYVLTFVISKLLFWAENKARRDEHGELKRRRRAVVPFHRKETADLASADIRSS